MHDLMSSGLGVWTPEMFGKLTPVQLYCMASKDRPGRHRISSLMEYEQMAAQLENWDS